jgi:MFS family permease
VTRELARIRDFRLLFAGLLATMVGDLLLTLMLAVWVAKLTGSDSAAGITIGCGVIAYAISPLIAWPADRFRRRPLIITVNVGTAVILIPLLTVPHSGRIWVIYAVAVAYGAASVIASAASQALIGLIVPAESTPDAYGALQTAQQSLRVLVPLLGVAIYTRMGPTVVVVMTVVSLLASAASVTAIRAPETRPEPAGQHWLAELTAGARNIAADRVMSRITLGNSSAMLAAGAFAVLGFAVVTDGLGKPAGFLSVLISVQAGTAVAAATVSARIVKRLGEIAATSLAFTLAGTGLILTVFPSLAVVVTAYALGGFAVPLGGVSAYSAAQRRIPRPAFARTMVAFTSAVALPQAIGIPAAAAALPIAGFRPLVLIAFAIMMLASVYMWRGRALTRPSREATPADVSTTTDETTHQGRPAVAPPAPSQRRPSRRPDIGGVHVESQAVQVSLGPIRTFDDQVEAIARAAARAGTPIRIGVHAGPLDKRLLARCGRASAQALTESAPCECVLFGERGFCGIKIPVRHHDPAVMISACRQLDARCDYPLYLGVTEAGPAFPGVVQPPAAFGALLAEGGGERIRVPWPVPPVEAVRPGRATLVSPRRRERGPHTESCPSCGRAQVGAYTLAGQVTVTLDGFTAPLRVAVDDILRPPEWHAARPESAGRG